MTENLTQQWALFYAAQGFEVFPVPPGTKGGYSDLKEELTGRPWGASPDPVVVRGAFDMHPDANIGIRTGEVSGIVVVDVDTTDGHKHNGFASLEKLLTENGAFPDTRQAQSPSGSVHYYFKHPGFFVKSLVGTDKKGLAPGIDIKGDGGMVVAAPSVKPGRGRYEWLTAPDFPIAQAPAWLLEWFKNQGGGKRPNKATGIARMAPAGLRPGPGTQAAKVLAAACEKIAVTESGRNTMLNEQAFLVGKYVGSGEIGRDVAEYDLLTACDECGLLADDGEAQCLATIRSGMPAGMKDPARTAGEMFNGVTTTAMPMMGRGDAQAKAWAPVLARIPELPRNDNHPEMPDTGHPLRDAINAAISGIIATGNVDALAVVTAAHADTASKIAPLISDLDHQAVSNRASGLIEEAEHLLRPADFVRETRTGEIQNDNIDNVAFFLSQLDAEIRWNDWTEAMEVRGWKWDDWTFVNDHVVTLLRARASQTGTRFRVGKDFLWDSLLALSLRQKVDPVLETLTQLEHAWNGIPRLDTWLHHACGVPNDAYHAAVSRNVIGGMVKRARNPGAKHDEVLLFIGEQGTNKSGVPEILALQKNWFSDEIELGDPSKELVLSLAGKLVVEIGEMGRKSVAGNNAVKSMLARCVDRGRTAYARTVTARPRRNIFVATTNDPEPLSDLTGNRRWLPVRIGAEIDVEWLRANVAQIVGEAAAREAKGETFRLPRELWRTAAEHQKSATETPDYQNVLLEWLAPTGLDVFMTIADLSHIAREAAGGRAVKSSEYNRVVEYLGFKRRTKRVDGKPIEVWLRGDGKDAYRVTAKSLRAIPRGVNLSMVMDSAAAEPGHSIPPLSTRAPLPLPPY